MIMSEMEEFVLFLSKSSRQNVVCKSMKDKEGLAAIHNENSIEELFITHFSCVRVKKKLAKINKQIRSEIQSN